MVGGRCLYDRMRSVRGKTQRSSFGVAIHTQPLHRLRAFEEFTSTDEIAAVPSQPRVAALRSHPPECHRAPEQPVAAAEEVLRPGQVLPLQRHPRLGQQHRCRKLARA
jgi:hypothetical protein